MAERLQVNRKVARAAAEWAILLSGEDVKPQDQDACLRWRQDQPEHEEAWQRTIMLQEKLGLVPKELALSTLGRTERVSRRQLLNGLASLIIAGPVAYAGYRHLPWQVVNNEYATAIGRQKQFALDEGTKLHLNTDTWVDVSYTQQARKIYLHHGEVYIETGHDVLNRPFELITPQGKAIPIGTAFNARRLRSSEQTEVQVFSGAVRLLPSHINAEQVIDAGQSSSFTRARIATVKANPKHKIDWVHGVLQAENMPLSELVVELGRYRYGWLRCDPAVENLRVSGAFQLDDTNLVLRSLRHSLPVEVVFRSDYWITILPASK